MCKIDSSHAQICQKLIPAPSNIINICKPNQPDEEQKRIYQMLGIDWKSAFPIRKTEIPA
jgi:hypothetical protein